MKKIGFILGVGALLLSGVQSAFALLVGVSATWDSASDANLVDGSIVQVIAYSATNGGGYPGGADGDENFQQYGSTTPVLQNGNQEGHVYIPDSTFASGNQIVYTGKIHVEGDKATFQTYVYLDNASAYDHIYIRVFSATNFPDDGQAHASWWGISTASNITAGAGTIGLVWWDNTVELSHQDYFEVIPEPGTLGMLGSGAFGVGVAGLWRRGRRKGKARAGETGVVEP